ncbi:unnamed protein product, partial [Musa banksii]
MQKQASERRPTFLMGREKKDCLVIKASHKNRQRITIIVISMIHLLHSHCEWNRICTCFGLALSLSLFVLPCAITERRRSFP